MTNPEADRPTDGSSIDAQRVGVVLFDLGGVVFEFAWPRAIDHWAAASGVAADELAGRLAFGAEDQAYERGELSESEYFAHLGSRLGVDLDEDTLIAGWNAIFGDLVPGIDESIDAVAASPLRGAALSNTNRTHAVAWSERYGATLDRLEVVLTSHELGHRKPDAACFTAACDALEVTPDTVLFFDDVAANVTGARAVGMQAVQVHGHDDVRAALAALGIT